MNFAPSHDLEQTNVEKQCEYRLKMIEQRNKEEGLTNSPSAERGAASFSEEKVFDMAVRFSSSAASFALAASSLALAARAMAALILA